MIWKVHVHVPQCSSSSVVVLFYFFPLLRLDFDVLSLAATDRAFSFAGDA
jgi:hypothetical protein